MGHRAPALLLMARALMKHPRKPPPRHWLSLALIAMEGACRLGVSPSLVYRTLEAMLGLPDSSEGNYGLKRIIAAQRRQAISEFGRDRPLYDVAADVRDVLSYMEREAREGPRRNSLDDLEQWCVLLLIALEGCWRSHPSIPAVTRALKRRVEGAPGRKY